MTVEPIIQTQNDFVRNSITGARMAVDAASNIIEKALHALYGDKLPVRGEISVRVISRQKTD